MTVWVLTESTYEGCILLGVFATEALAQAAEVEAAGYLKAKGWDILPDYSVDAEEVVGA